MGETRVGEALDREGRVRFYVRDKYDPVWGFVVELTWGSQVQDCVDEELFDLHFGSPQVRKLVRVTAWTPSGSSSIQVDFRRLIPIDDRGRAWLALQRVRAS